MQAQASSLIDKQICDTYNRYIRDAAAGNIQASYGLFSGVVSLNKESVEAIGKVMCSHDFSRSASDNLVNRASSLLNANAISAWRACMSARETRGLQATWRFREEDQRFASLEVEYVPPPAGSREIKVYRVIIHPAQDLRCQGELKDMEGRSLKASVRYSLSCERLTYSPPKKVPGLGEVHAEPATIQLNTEAGQLRADWRAIRPASPPPVSVLPVGTVIPYLGRISTLTDVPPGWLVCDGSEVKASQYPELRAALGTSYGRPSAADTFKLPNLQGLFLRGFDPGGTVDKGADERTLPDGKQGNGLGSTEGYATALPSKTGFSTSTNGAHTHALNLESTAGRADGSVKNTVANPSCCGSAEPGTRSAGEHAHAVDKGGDAETRPVNMAVYYLIKALREAPVPSRL